MVESGEGATGPWLVRAIGCTAAIVALFYFGALWLGRTLGPVKVVGRSVQCQGNLRLLVRAQQMYADDYADTLPPAAQWMDRTDFYVSAEPRDPRYCPEVGLPGGSKYGYAMNGRLGGKERSKVHDLERQPLLFDSPDLSRSAVMQSLQLPKPGRHIGNEKKGQKLARGNYVGLASGGVRFRPDSTLP